MLYDLALMPSTESLKLEIFSKYYLFVFSSKTSTIFPIGKPSMPIVPHYNSPLKIIVLQFLHFVEFSPFKSMLLSPQIQHFCLKTFGNCNRLRFRE